VKSYIKEVGRANLRKRLKEGAIHEAELDRGLAEEWYTLDEEAWQKLDK